MQWSGCASISVSNWKVCWSCVHIFRGSVVCVGFFWLSISASSKLNACSSGLAGRDFICSLRIWMACRSTSSLSLSASVLIAILAIRRFVLLKFV